MADMWLWLNREFAGIYFILFTVIY